MSDLLAITSDAPVCKILTCIPDKFVVDFANGIDVSRDQLRVQKDRSTFFSRCFDGFSGQALRRQSAINSRLVDGVEASLNWLTELTESLSESNFAIARINDRVNELKQDVAQIANFSVDTRLAFNALYERVDFLSRDHQIRLDWIELEARAKLCIDSVFEKWRAGRFGCFSLGGRCYAAMEELRWGGLGNYLSQNGQERQRLLEMVADRATSQLRDDAKASSSHARLDIRQHWLAMPMQFAVIPDTTEALAYVGDVFDADRHPFSYAISQQVMDLPDGIPRICNAQRLSEALVSEVLESDIYG